MGQGIVESQQGIEASSADRDEVRKLPPLAAVLEQMGEAEHSNSN
jgi:hypothetical protein